MTSGKPEVISEDKQVIRVVADTFGGDHSIERIRDKSGKYEISVLGAANRPGPGIHSYSTIGLWRTQLESNPLLRLEVVAAFPSDKEGFRAILAAAAFRIMRTQKPAVPGDVFPDYVRDWYPKCTVPHLFFTLPSSWEEDSLTHMSMGNLEVRFMQVLPITQPEYEYLLEHGEDSLELKMIGHHVDFYDLKRKSAV